MALLVVLRRGGRDHALAVERERWAAKPWRSHSDDAAAEASSANTARQVVAAAVAVERVQRVRMPAQESLEASGSTLGLEAEPLADKWVNLACKEQQPLGSLGSTMDSTRARSD